MVKMHQNISYEDTGRGDVLVLLHGFGEDGTVWKHQVLEFQEKYRLIVPDLPGSGLSPLSVITMETLAAQIKSLLDHEKIHRACVVGHSMGGYVALAFAEAYPGMLRGLGLFHSTAKADSPEKQQARKKGISFIRENGSAPFLKQSTPNLFAEKYKLENPGEVSALIQRGASFNPDSLIAYYEAMLRRPDRTKVLLDLRKPLLLIAGALDTAIPLPESLSQAALADTTYFHILEEAAHMGMWESKERAGQALSQYLNNIFQHE